MGFGSWVSFDYQLDVPQAKVLIERAYRGGINFFDNAEVYAMGRSEEIMGQALKELAIPRCDIVVTTKVYHGCTREPTPTARGLSRKHIIEGIKASLVRMQLDYVDVVFAHRYDEVPMEEIVRAFNWVIEQGLAFYWGTSEWSAAQIMEAWEVADRLGLIGPICEQPHYNMMHRKRVEHDLKPLIDTKGLGLTTWSPLASGLLSGKYSTTESVPSGSRFAVERYRNLKEGLLTEDNLEAVERLKPIAEKYGVSMAQLALAWTMSNKDVSTVLTGATKVEQLEENLKAVQLVPLFESGEISWSEVGNAISPSTSVMSRF